MYVCMSVCMYACMYMLMFACVLSKRALLTHIYLYTWSFSSWSRMPTSLHSSFCRSLSLDVWNLLRKAMSSLWIPQKRRPILCVHGYSREDGPRKQSRCVLMYLPTATDTYIHKYICAVWMSIVVRIADIHLHIHIYICIFFYFFFMGVLSPLCLSNATVRFSSMSFLVF